MSMTTSATSGSYSAPSAPTPPQDSQFAGVSSSAASGNLSQIVVESVGSTASSVDTVVARTINSDSSPVVSHADSLPRFDSAEKVLIETDTRPEGFSWVLWDTVQIVNRLVNRVFPGGTGSVTYIATTFENATDTLRSAVLCFRTLRRWIW